jgi:hypothetical protein
MEKMAQLAEIITRFAPATGMYGTPLKCLSLFRADQPTLPIPSVYEASLCLIAQGSTVDASTAWSMTRRIICWCRSTCR